MFFLCFSQVFENLRISLPAGDAFGGFAVAVAVVGSGSFVEEKFHGRGMPIVYGPEKGSLAGPILGVHRDSLPEEPTYDSVEAADGRHVESGVSAIIGGVCLATPHGEMFHDLKITPAGGKDHQGQPRMVARIQIGFPGESLSDTGNIPGFNRLEQACGFVIIPFLGYALPFGCILFRTSDGSRDFLHHTVDDIPDDVIKNLAGSRSCSGQAQEKRRADRDVSHDIAA